MRLATTDEKVMCFLKNQDELHFEFQDNNFKSTIKKLKYENDSGQEVIISINRFSEEMMKKFIKNGFSVRDQYMIS